MKTRTLCTLALLFMVGCSSLPKGPAPETNLNHRTTAFHNMGNKCVSQREFQKALTFYGKALSIHASVDDQAGVARSLLSMGQVFLCREDAFGAETNYHSASLAAVGSQRSDLWIRAQCGLAKAQVLRRNYDEAMDILMTAKAKGLPTNQGAQAVWWHDLGVVSSKQEDWAQAQASLQKALALNEATNNRQGIAGDCYSLAVVHQDQGKFQEALPFARRALSQDKATGQAAAVAQDLTLLALLSDALADHEASRDYRRRAIMAWQGLGRKDLADELASQP